MEQTIEQNTTETGIKSSNQFLINLIAMFVLSTGITLFVFGLAYARDLETLRTVPGAVWSAICGKPVDNGYTLPLMMTISTLFAFVGAGLLGWQRFSRR